jgi:hypothetical protein
MNSVNTSVNGNEKESLNRGEFRRRRCCTAAQREAAMDKIPGLTPQERGETVPRGPDASQTLTQACPGCDPGLTEV